MVEVRVTYETLFDLLRREKSRNELQDLDQTFFVDVVSYLRQKHSSLSESGSTTTRAEQEKVRIQIKNIKRILKELYELREKKVLNLALNKTRTGSNLIDTSKMLFEERQLFEEAVVLLDKFRHGVIERVSGMELPSIESSGTFSQDLYANRVQAVNDEETEQEHEDTFISAQADLKARREAEKDESKISSYSNEVKSATSPNGFVRVRFLSSLPKFMGLDKKIYGPYNKEDVEVIPSNMAELLMKKGRIELAEN